MKRVLVIGGYGNFGAYICKSLAQDPNIKLLIAGRSLHKAINFCDKLSARNAPEAFELDIQKNVDHAFINMRPDIVIHTSGPFQGQGYQVAEACLAHNCHYIDLADAREFVEGIQFFNDDACKKGILITSGASSVPCLTSAIISHYLSHFQEIHSVEYGITTAQKTNRGVATTAAILSYTGKSFHTLSNGQIKKIYGWQNIHARKFPKLGWRLLGNCNVPDLALFPSHYPTLRSIRFYAGLEIPFLHVCLWGLSWLVRWRIIHNLEVTAPLLLKLSHLLDFCGTANSGFFMQISGIDDQNAPKNITFDLTASQGDGPYIPCMPSILLCKKLAAGEIANIGAVPCIGLITMNEYLDALENLAIEWQIT